jgi:hypothetical protein
MYSKFGVSFPLLVIMALNRYHSHILSVISEIIKIVNFNLTYSKQMINIRRIVYNTQ